MRLEGRCWARPRSIRSVLGDRALGSAGSVQVRGRSGFLWSVAFGVFWSGEDSGAGVITGGWEEAVERSRWEVMGREEAVELERENR